MYVKREVIDADRAARRALPDGLRGRRLVPARVAGRLPRALLPAGDALTTTSRSRAARRSASASAPRRTPSGSAGAASSTSATSVRQSGALRIVYVTEDTGVGGGHRDIFEHLNRLRDARPRRRAVHARRAARLVRRCSPGGDASRTTTRSPRRSPRRTRSRSRPGGTRPPPSGARSVLRGIPVYFVQDIETSYYPDDEAHAQRTSWLATATSSAT